jgi:two-component system KDP operon response regulator KdpE
LIVDDEPPIRKLLRMGLTTQGYAILDAPNGKTALELLDHQPDLVILERVRQGRSARRWRR